jgi:hypothetical protein
MPKIGDTRPDPLARPARQDEIEKLLTGGLGTKAKGRKM